MTNKEKTNKLIKRILHKGFIQTNCLRPFALQTKYFFFELGLKEIYVYSKSSVKPIKVISLR